MGSRLNTLVVGFLTIACVPWAIRQTAAEPPVPSRARQGFNGIPAVLLTKDLTADAQRNSPQLFRDWTELRQIPAELHFDGSPAGAPTPRTPVDCTGFGGYEQPFDDEGGAGLGFNTARPSDVETGLEVREDIVDANGIIAPLPTGNVASIRFWGVSIAFDPAVGYVSQCLEDNNANTPYNVLFYADAAGTPGALLDQRLGVAPSAIVDLAVPFNLGATVHQYEVTFAVPVDTTGIRWIGIERDTGVNQAGTNLPCFFLWVDEARPTTYDDISWWNGALELSDQTLCIDIDSGPPVQGQCCDTSTGGCTAPVLSSACTGPFDVFTAAGTCNPANPPCSVLTGACCDEVSGICSDLTPVLNCQGVNQTFTPAEVCANVQCAACAPVPPAPNCPGGAHLEAEACGADTNGGCNDGPAFPLELINLGDTVCGTAWSDAGIGARDLDWYEFNLPQEGVIRITADANFPMALFIVDLFNGPCPNPVVLEAAEFALGQAAEISSDCLPAGTYVVVAGVSTNGGAFDVPALCGTQCENGNDYTFTVTTDGCPGSCCSLVCPGECIDGFLPSECATLGPNWIFTPSGICGVNDACFGLPRPENCCKGDINEDDEINGADIASLVDMIVNQVVCDIDPLTGLFSRSFCNADMNRDNLVSLGDVGPFVDILLDPVPCPLPPLQCNETPTECQIPNQMANGGTFAATSDRNPGILAAANFVPLVSGDITTVCWWGYYLDFGIGADCSPFEPDDFMITYYADDGSATVPDTNTVLGGPFAIVPTKLPTGNLIQTGGGDRFEHRYTAQHPPVSVTAGQCIWVEITNDTGAGTCVWLWQTAPAGDGRSAQDTGTGFGPSGFDLAFCAGIQIASDGCGPQSFPCNGNLGQLQCANGVTGTGPADGVNGIMPNVAVFGGWGTMGLLEDFCLTAPTSLLNFNFQFVDAIAPTQNDGLANSPVGSVQIRLYDLNGLPLMSLADLDPATSVPVLDVTVNLGAGLTKSICVPDPFAANDTECLDVTLPVPQPLAPGRYGLWVSLPGIGPGPYFMTTAPFNNFSPEPGNQFGIGAGGQNVPWGSAGGLDLSFCIAP